MKAILATPSEVEASSCLRDTYRYWEELNHHDVKIALQNVHYCTSDNALILGEWKVQTTPAGYLRPVSGPAMMAGILLFYIIFLSTNESHHSFEPYNRLIHLFFWREFRIVCSVFSGSASICTAQHSIGNCFPSPINQLDQPNPQSPNSEARRS